MPILFMFLSLLHMEKLSVEEDERWIEEQKKQKEQKERQKKNRDE